MSSRDCKSQILVDLKPVPFGEGLEERIENIVDHSENVSQNSFLF